LALELPCAALAQNRPGSANPQTKNPSAAIGGGVYSALGPGPANFDAHDLSGIWNMSFPQNATQAELEVYVSQFGKGDPPMTPWDSTTRPGSIVPGIRIRIGSTSPSGCAASPRTDCRSISPSKIRSRMRGRLRRACSFAGIRIGA